MRRGEILALQWRDINWFDKTLSIHKAIWHQRVGPVKTECSERTMPLDDAMLRDLQRWRETTPYAGEEDWIFASPRMHGRQPLWPEPVIRNHIQPAAERACIAKHVTWHCFRHSFSTLLVDNKQRREDGAAHDASRQQSRHSGTVYGSDRRKNPEGARPDRRAGAHRAPPSNAGGWKCF
jgi:integrase